MPAGKANAPDPALRQLPSVDELLRVDRVVEIAEVAGRRHATSLARQAIAGLRKELRGAGDAVSKDELTARATAIIEDAWRMEELSSVRRVINATGVIIHTNLGRAPLSQKARDAIADASGYCTLEYDLATGKRGKRGISAERLIVELTGAEDALIVNNCAAAAFFVLKVFAEGGEVVVSRGELVEIGGDFRVPDVLSQSGAGLREVGTTNRTKLTDYAKAVNKNTRAILRVHPSNYRIVGFTATPTLDELATLAKKRKVLLYEDVGSGAMADLSGVGLTDEPVVRRSIADGADIVTFSGDKLLGGPQAGIIAGKKRLIETLRKHPLYRALRADKLILAGLTATLEDHRRAALSDIPVMGMLSATSDDLARRVKRFVAAMEKRLGENSDLRFEITNGQSAVGGGAAPAAKLSTTLIALRHNTIPVQRLEQMLRLGEQPVIARIVGDRLMIDLRTVARNEEARLSEMLGALA